MMKVLFVEDDKGLVFLAERFGIWDEGKFCLEAVANNGKEALEMLRSREFDIVLTDICMPIIDGIELLRQIRSEGMNVQVILASDYSDFRYAKEGLRLGAVEYIEKPYTEQKVREAFLLIRVQEEGALKESNREKMYERLLTSELSQNMKESIPEELEAGEERKELVEYLWNRLIKDAICLRHLAEKPAVTEFLSEKELIDYIHYMEELVGKYHLDKPDSLMSRMETLLEESVGEAGMLDRLSEEMELSKDYLSRLFREKWGIPISEYCTILKIDRSKMLLETTNYKVYEIAERLGYTTVDYFTRLFKNYVGCTPLRYRKYRNKEQM